MSPYGDIHHRAERFEGVGDGELGISFVGLTIPFGRTEPDPIERGRLGLKHEHIQFGSGTVGPKLSVQWSRPLDGSSSPRRWTRRDVPPGHDVLGRPHSLPVPLDLRAVIMSCSLASIAG